MPSIRLDEGLSLHCAVDDYLWPWEALLRGGYRLYCAPA
jgi:hypothetical protein